MILENDYMRQVWLSRQDRDYLRRVLSDERDVISEMLNDPNASAKDRLVTTEAQFRNHRLLEQLKSN